jgi:hypothetical protein
VRVIGSKALISEKDSVVRIPEMNAFTNYIIEFSDIDLDNIAWRFKNKRYQVMIDPNQFKRVDIPVVTVGEVNGMVYMNQENGLKGIGRILVNIYHKGNKQKIAETLSETDGYVSYLGLEPGDYVACVDSVQLNNLDITADPVQTEFSIKPAEEGDIAGVIRFVLQDRENVDAIKIDSIPNTGMKINDETVVWGRECTQPGNYYVQCGAFKYENNAMKMALGIIKMTAETVGIVSVDGLYKVQVGCFTTKHEAESGRTDLIEMGVLEDIFYRKR